ncbi:MAG TPA: transporter [Telluria sp.]
MRRSSVLMLLAALAGLTTLPAVADDINADRPGLADDSGVVGAGRLQVEAGLQREWRRSENSSERLTYVPALLRVGIDEHWEARIEGNGFSWQNQSDAARSTGAMPVSLGVKYHVAGNGESGNPGVSVIARVFPRSGAGAFGTHRATGDVRLVADVALTPDWSVTPNIGVARQEDDAGRQFNTALLAGTLTYAASKQFNVFVDTGMQSREERHGRKQVLVDTGVAYVLTPDVQLDASIGRGTHGATPPRVFASAGVSVRF